MMIRSPTKPRLFWGGRVSGAPRACASLDGVGQRSRECESICRHGSVHSPTPPFRRKSMARCTGAAPRLLPGVADGPPDEADVCWLCREPGGADLVRPGGCKCKGSAGWVHRACMSTYLPAQTNDLTVTHSIGAPVAYVYIVHLSCVEPMLVAKVPLCRHMDVWIFAYDRVRSFVSDAYHRFVAAMLAAFALGLAMHAWKAWPLYAAGLVVAIATPLTRFEMAHWDSALITCNWLWALSLVVPSCPPVALACLLAATLRTLLACANEAIAVRHCVWKIARGIFE